MVPSLVSDIGSDQEGYLSNKWKVDRPLEFWKMPETQDLRMESIHSSTHTDPQLESADRTVVVASVVAVMDASKDPKQSARQDVFW